MGKRLGTVAMTIAMCLLVAMGCAGCRQNSDESFTLKLQSGAGNISEHLYKVSYTCGDDRTIKTWLSGSNTYFKLTLYFYTDNGETYYKDWNILCSGNKNAGSVPALEVYASNFDWDGYSSITTVKAKIDTYTSSNPSEEWWSSEAPCYLAKPSS